MMKECLMKIQEEEKTILNNGDGQKKEWEKPDIHIYPIENTLNQSGSGGDGTLAS
jgi:hypothetical protein